MHVGFMSTKIRSLCQRQKLCCSRNFEESEKQCQNKVRTSHSNSFVCEALCKLIYQASYRNAHQITP